MGMTHIIRGADHISNTPKQVLQYQALGAPLPIFAHVPLILGPDKTRLSKRHGATSVMAYQELGIVPEAFLGSLGLLGWGPGAAGKTADGKDREIFASEDLICLFSRTASRTPTRCLITTNWRGLTRSTSARIRRSSCCL